MEASECCIGLSQQNREVSNQLVSLLLKSFRNEREHHLPDIHFAFPARLGNSRDSSRNTLGVKLSSILEGHVAGVPIFFHAHQVGWFTLVEVMLRNLPNNYTREMLLTLLNDKGFAGRSLEF